MQSALPAVTLEVWTQSLAANHTPSGYWNSVFKSGALNSVGPLGLKLTGRFLNATTQLVRPCYRHIASDIASDSVYCDQVQSVAP